MIDDYQAIDVDFNTLLDKSVQDIQQYAPDSWTDHSTSDPGVTILEQLIVQFTRLSEKLDLPLGDLLASTGDIQSQSDTPALAYSKSVEVKDQYFRAGKALTCAPVSVNDRRRVVLDHPLVANVTVEPVQVIEQPLFWDDVAKRMTFDELKGDHSLALPGRYRALVELVEAHGLDDTQKRELSAELLERLKLKRNLCEQWHEVIMLEPEWIKLKGSLALKPGTDVEQSLIDIHQAIADYINPPLSAKDKDLLRQQGRNSSEIYHGPMLQHGYYDEKDLNTVHMRTELRASDIIRIILTFDEVAHVHSLQLSNFDNPRDDDWHDWVLKVSSGRVARLEPILTQTESSSEVTGFIDCFKNNTLCRLDAALIEQRLAARAQARKSADAQLVCRDIPLPQGKVQDLSYHSVQQLFPVVYGLGDNQLPDSVGKERLAKVKQLQGFLMLFDQVIANYHQQLADMGDLLDIKQRPATSYRVGQFDCQDQALLAVDDYWSQIRQLVEQAMTQEQAQLHHSRENRLMDHLFARLGESFSDHSLLGYSFAKESFDTYLSGKSHCLSQLAELAHDRFIGNDFASNLPCATVRRIAAKLGLNEQGGEALPVLVEHTLLYPETDTVIPVPYHSATLFAQLRSDGNYYTVMDAPGHRLRNEERISLFDFSHDKEGEYAGLYEVKVIDENLLELRLNLGLNPENDEIDTVFSLRWMRGPQVQNPYAMQVSLVLNGQSGRFADGDFRRGVEVLARAELPAHLALNLRWLSDADWEDFNRLHNDWLTPFATWWQGRDADEMQQAAIDRAAARLLTFLL